MNKGIRGRKSSKVHGAGVMRCYKRTSRASFDRQERAIERTQRQRDR